MVSFINLKYCIKLHTSTILIKMESTGKNPIDSMVALRDGEEPG